MRWLVPLAALASLSCGAHGVDKPRANRLIHEALYSERAEQALRAAGPELAQDPASMSTLALAVLRLRDREERSVP